MRLHIPLAIFVLYVFGFLGTTVQAQQDQPEAHSGNSAQKQGTDPILVGVVISATPDTLVIRSDDSRYHLFTYDAHTISQETVKPGARVRVHASAPDGHGTQVAKDVDLTQPGTDTAGSGPDAQAMPPSPKVNNVSREIENEARLWHVGGRVGMGFSPELFMFGPQSQFGPFFSQRLLFRPNVEFGFGELTDLFAVNAEAAYRFSTAIHGQWTPYFGMGPSFNFINQSASSGTVSFSNFTYKNGFNVFVGGQKRKTFVEMKTSLFSSKAPVLRVFVGYNF